MELLQPGSAAPPISKVDFAAGPTALWFFKVTCPVCQMAAPVAHVFEEAYPGRVAAVGQDPPEKLAEFDRTYGLGSTIRADFPPYPASNAYGISVVPTLYLVDTQGTVLDVVESWDLDGYRRASGRLAELLESPPANLAVVTKDLPRFRPG